MTILDILSELEAKASKGPWLYGNEPRCLQQEHVFFKTNEGGTRTICVATYNGEPFSTEMRFIASIRNNARALIDVAVLAKEAIDSFDVHEEDMGLNRRAIRELAAALSRLEAK